MEIIDQIKNLGFERVFLESYYAPLKLQCIAIREIKIKDSSPTAYSSNSDIIGSNGFGYKSFHIGKTYSLYCMYGRDIFDEYYLFCNDTSDSPCFKIIYGQFKFVFDAKEFFQLLKNANLKSWNNFADNAVLKDENELLLFKKLINASTELTAEKRKLANDFITKIR